MPKFEEVVASLKKDGFLDVDPLSIRIEKSGGCTCKYCKKYTSEVMLWFRCADRLRCVCPDRPVCRKHAADRVRDMARDKVDADAKRIVDVEAGVTL